MKYESDETSTEAQLGIGEANTKDAEKRPFLTEATDKTTTALGALIIGITTFVDEILDAFRGRLIALGEWLKSVASKVPNLKEKP